MFNMNFADMKKTLYITICLLLGMSACFEDEGNYEYHGLPTFYVDTVGVQTALTITQFDALSMESHLVYEGNKSDLEFTWSMYAGSSHGSDVFADTLAKTENLSATIEASPGNYTIEFCAMEKATGVRTTMCYAVTVESATGTGLLVYYQKDGTADCDLIKTPLFNGTLTESTVTRQIYSQANPDYPLTGELVGCGFLNSGNTSWVTLMTETDAVQLSYEDMSIMREFDEMFWSAPETCKPQGYYFANSLEVLVNDGKVYTDIISWAEKPLFASAKILMNDDYQSASCAYAGYGQTLIVYDELKGRFLYSNVFSSELLEIDYDPAKSAYDMTAIGNGSDEVIDMLMRIFCVPGSDCVMVERPTYGEYGVLASLNNARVLDVPLLPTLQLDVEGMVSAIREQKPKIVFICSPNNPTGIVYSLEDIARIAEENKGITVVDEAYCDFAEGFRSACGLIRENRRIVVMRTLSKAWGLAGARLGVLVADPEVIAVFNKAKAPYNVSRLGQEAALRALSDADAVREDIEGIRRGRKHLAAFLLLLPFVRWVIPSEANFILIGVDSPAGLCSYLASKGIVIRNRSSEPLLEGGVRITIGSAEENRKLEEALVGYVEA